MSLPKNPVAVDATTNTSQFWNDLVENYEAIFDGSAFDPGTVTTKYGTVARYIKLDAGNTTAAANLEVGAAYLILIKDNPDPDHQNQLGLFSNGVQQMGITQGGYSGSKDKVNAGVIVPTTTGFNATVQNGGPTDDTETEFIVIKLDNNASDWATSATLPSTGISFATSEILTGQKVNRVIDNVNAGATALDSIPSESVDIANNTKNSMSVIARKSLSQIMSPAAVNTSDVVASLEFEITENLESSIIIVTGTAYRRQTLLSWLTPTKIEIFDSSDDLVADHEADPLTWFFVNLSQLTAGAYKIDLTYHLGNDPNFDGILVSGVPINITVLGFGA